MGGVGCSLDLDYLKGDGRPTVDAAVEDSRGDEVSSPPDAFAPDSSALGDAAEGRDGTPHADAADGRDGSDGGSSGDAPPPNLIVNPGFENATTGWYTWEGTVVASSAQAHSGSYSGCLEGPTQDGRGPAQDVSAVVQSSRQYSFSAWVRWGSAVADNGGNTGSGDDASSDAETSPTGEAGTGDAGTGDAGTGDAGTGDAGTGDAGTGDAGGASATLYEDVKAVMVALCPDGSAHFGACVSGILAPEGTWTELVGICDGSIVGLCGEAGPPQVELYFDTGDPGIGLCVDDVSLTSN